MAMGGGAETHLGIIQLETLGRAGSLERYLNFGLWDKVGKGITHRQGNPEKGRGLGER